MNENVDGGESDGVSRRKALLGAGALGLGSAMLPVASADQGDDHDGGRNDENVAGTPIRDWSQMALDTVIEGEIAIPDSGRLYAIVHVAMHDAVNGVNQQRGDGFEARDQIIVDGVPPVPGASRVAAVAKAAKVTLEETLLDYLDAEDEVVRTLQDDYDALLEKHTENDTDGNTRAGLQWGERVGNAVREAREGSGFFEPDEDYPPEEYDPEDLNPGQSQTAHVWGNANLGNLDPWTLDSPDEIRTDVIGEEEYKEEIAPPDLEDIEWAVDYEKTKLLGDMSDVDLDSEEELDEEDFTVTWSVDDDPVDEDDLQDAVDWIEGRDTEVSAREFDNESVEVLEEDDDGNPTEIALEFTRPEGFDELGQFWVALPGTAQPDGRWIQIANALSEREDLGFTENAWLVADVAIAAVDGAVTSWNTKRDYAIKENIGWRPHSPLDSPEKNGGIKDDDPPTAADDGNPLTEPASDWETISAHAASGEHPSGLTLASTAAQNVLDDYFPKFDEDSDEYDEDETFSVTVLASGMGAEEGEETTEEFASFEEARRIAMDTREYTGRHWRYSLEASATMGQKLAEQILGE